MIVEREKIDVTDSGALLELWENARLEYDAARHLLLADGRGFDRAVALHLLRGWHALATMHARRSGLPDPEFESFEIADDSEILAPIARRRRAPWGDSFTTVREAALAKTGSDDPPQVERQSLELQLRLLGRCIANRRADAMATAGWSLAKLFRMRQLLTAIAALVLILVAVGLARRLEEVGDEALYPDVAEVSEPETARVDLGQLSDFKPRGYPWDGPGNVVFRDRLLVTLDEIKHPGVLSLGLDGNDRYSLALIRGNMQVEILEVGPSASHGLEAYRVEVPQEAADRGFDSILIEVVDGDGAYSIGHLLLENPGDPAKP